MNFTIGNTQIQFIKESKFHIVKIFNNNHIFISNLSGWLLTTQLSDSINIINTNTIEIRYKDTKSSNDMNDIKKPVLLSFLLKKQMKLLHYNQVSQLFKNSVDFINYLTSIDSPQTIGFFTSKDFIIVDGLFIFLNDNKIFDLDITNEKIVIDKYFNNRGFDSYFISPEFFNGNMIPRMIPKSSTYYSLGCLIIFCLFGNIPKPNERDIKNSIEGIIATKLYWCLLRCMELDSKKRQLYFI